MKAKEVPARPSLEQYKKQAKDLVKAYKSGESETIRRIKEFHPHAGKLLDSGALKAGFGLAYAQIIIAREHGFESWPKFAKHLEELARKSSLPSRFEAAADAIVSGDAATLKRLLGEDQKLVRAISTREHSATLLHYASANGVEGYRQKTPANIVEITEMLLNAVPKLMPQLRCTAADARLWGWRRLASIPSALAYRKHCSRRFWIMVPVLSSLPLQATSNPL